MMHQLIDKNKYFIYIFSFLFLSTLNNLSLNELNFFKIKTIEIFEEDLKTNTLIQDDLAKKLMIFKNQNIFLINKDQIKSQILKNEWILKFSIQKKYPSKLMVNTLRETFETAPYCYFTPSMLKARESQGDTEV